MARPKANIDGAEVEKLASFGLTNREIGEVVGASEATIGRRFASETTKGRGNLKKSLRRKQVELALGGNATMLIWLGKNYLDQKDKQELSGDGDKPIVHSIVKGYVTINPDDWDKTNNNI